MNMSLHMWYFYRPRTKLQEGNVFTPVSFCSREGGGLCPSMCHRGSLTRGSLSRGGLCPGAEVVGR